MGHLDIAKDAEKQAVLRIDFQADNNGTAFARNYNGSVKIRVVSWASGEYQDVHVIDLG